jgi:hypothetical protein
MQVGESMTRRHPLSPILFLVRNPGRSLPLTLVLALAVLTIASVVALLNSIDRTILKIYDYNRYFAAITPRGSNRLKPELMERLKQAPYYATSHETVVCFMNAETIVGKMPFVIFGLEQEQMPLLAARCKLTLREGRYPRSGEAGVVLSEPLMRNKNLKLGDVVLSPLIPDQYAPVPVRVVGVLKGDTWLAIGSLEFIRDNFFPPTRNLLILRPSRVISRDWMLGYAKPSRASRRACGLTPNSKKRPTAPSETSTSSRGLWWWWSR